MSPYGGRSVSRRGLLLGASALVVGTTAACSTTGVAPSPATPRGPGTPASTPVPASSSARTAGAPSTGSRTLLAYFSRPGENYYRGGRRNLELGNTEVIARMMTNLTPCDVHRIEAADPYPTAYDATVDRNGREQRADARPKIANPLDSIEQ